MTEQAEPEVVRVTVDIYKRKWLGMVERDWYVITGELRGRQLRGEGWSERTALTALAIKADKIVKKVGTRLPFND